MWIGTLDEVRAAYKRLTKRVYPYEDDPNGGRFVLIDNGNIIDKKWLVFAANEACLAHELCHVLLHTFRVIGHDPRDGDGEPFCYMLSQLMLEAK